MQADDNSSNDRRDGEKRKEKKIVELFNSASLMPDRANVIG